MEARLLAPTRSTNERIPINDLSTGWLAEDPGAHAAALRVLRRGWYVNGPELEAFEHELASHIGTDKAVGVANGTDALTIALIATGLVGHEVLTAANAGGYASTAAALAGCRVAYADVDARTLVLTPDTIESAIGPDTRGVVVTHLYGNLAPIREIVAFCRPRSIVVIEDAAQAIGGSEVAVHSDATAFSFYPTKNLGAAGDAGAICTSSEDVAAAAKRLRQYGWDQRYRVATPGGRNSRLDEIHAAMLRVGLPHLAEMTAARSAIVERYRQALAGSALQMVTGSIATVAHLAVVRSADRERLRDALDAAGIDTDIHYPIPDHRQPGLPPPSRQLPLPVTETTVAEILTIPCYPSMTPSAIDHVAASLHEAGR